MLNVQGFWTGHVSSRENSRGQGAVAYLISRRVPATGRRGPVGTVNRVTARYQVHAIVPLSQRGLLYR